MERQQLFYRHKTILKDWLLPGEEIYEPELQSSKYLIDS